MPGSEFLPPSKMSSRSSTKEKSKFNSVVNRNDSCDTTESDNEDDIPFIIYSEKIKINWPIFIFQKEDIVGEKDNEKDLDTEVSVDNIKFEGKYGKKIYESNILSKSHFNLKLKSVRLSFLPGFARKYIYNNNSNTLDFRFKLVINEGVGEKEEKELVDLSVKDRLDEFLTNTDCVRMEKAINTNHSLKRNYGKNSMNLRQYNISIYKSINKRIELNKKLLYEMKNHTANTVFEIYIEKEINKNKVLICKSNINLDIEKINAIRKDGGTQVLAEINDITNSNDTKYRNVLGYVQLYIQK